MRSLLLVLALPLFAESADVQLFVDPVGLNQLAFDARVVNYGPDVARNVVLAIDMPEGLTFEGAGGLACDTSADPIRCSIGDLPADPLGTLLHIELRQDGFHDGTFAVILSVQSDTPDPELTLNTRTVTIERRVLADLNVQILPGVARVDPGQTQKFAIEVANYFNIITPRDVRIDIVVADGTIEDIQPPAGVTCAIASETTATCTAPTLEEHCWCLPPIEVTVRASVDRNGGRTTLTAHAASDLEELYTENNEVTATTERYRWLIVDKIADDGPGSLRDAITRANAECNVQPCKIAFEIPAPVPAEGWFTITPASPLPAITADRVAIVGTTQTAFTGDTNADGPEIAIDGRLAHRGLEMKSRCEGIVEGLALGNFDENQALWTTVPAYCEGSEAVDRLAVRNNFIGVDPAGRPWPNLRGIRADDSFAAIAQNVISHNTYGGIWIWRGHLDAFENTIAHNGASGILVGPEAEANILSNTIAFNAQMGVAAARGKHLVDIRQNAMKDNRGLGIDWGLDGVSPVDGDDRGAPSNAPVLTSAVYRDGKTYVTFTIMTGPLGPYGNAFQLDFYVNDGPDADGERWVFANTIYSTSTAEIDGDYRGKWINATSTRTHFIFAKPPGVSSQSIAGGESSTSELSNAVLVQ